MLQKQEYKKGKFCEHIFRLIVSAMILSECKVIYILKMILILRKIMKAEGIS